jgi:hypothetical protein
LVAVVVTEVCRMAANGYAPGADGDPMNRNGSPSMVASPVMAVTRPVQNVGQLPGRLSAASQVLRYGDRTASGTAGGRSAAVWPAALPPAVSPAVRSAVSLAARPAVSLAARPAVSLAARPAHAGAGSTEPAASPTPAVVPNWSRRRRDAIDTSECR